VIFSRLIFPANSEPLLGTARNRLENSPFRVLEDLLVSSPSMSNGQLRCDQLLPSAGLPSLLAPRNRSAFIAISTKVSPPVFLSACLQRLSDQHLLLPYNPYLADLSTCPQIRSTPHPPPPPVPSGYFSRLSDLAQARAHAPRGGANGAVLFCATP